jgi:hypothetical protein
MIELPNEVDYIIVGETTMRPQKAYSYRYDGMEKGECFMETFFCGLSDQLVY